jgi:hypothetical protein
MMKRIYNLYRYHMANIPIYMTKSRGPLDYFIWSNCLFGISIDNPSPHIRFDENSILMFDYGGSVGIKYNPAYIGWWALINLKKYLIASEKMSLDNFRSQVAWFLKNQKEGKGKSATWTYDFDWYEGGTFLKAPWISAMSQGLAISCLIRAYRLEGDDKFLELAHKASKVFELKIEDGGVRTVDKGKVFYEEYPAHPIVRILDGFIFGLLGLYDLYEETKDQHVKKLFDEGIEGLRSHMEAWNYRYVWSWYGNHGILSPPEYNKLNAVFMGVLYMLTHYPSFKLLWKAWDNEQKNVFGKMKTLFFLILRRMK